MRLLLSSFFFVLALPCIAQDKPIPIDEEGHHHLVLENEYTRVFHTEVPPKQSTLMHQHDHDYVWVQIGPADVRNERVGSTPAEVKLKDGDVKFIKGGFAHKVTNLMDSPFVNITIEVKKPATKPICNASWPGSEPAENKACGFTMVTGMAGQNYEFETDTVQGRTWFLVGTGTGVTPGDYDKPRLLVALTRLHCYCGGTQDLQMTTGDVAWVAKGSQEDVRKVGSESPRFVIVSFN